MRERERERKKEREREREREGEREDSKSDARPARSRGHSKPAGRETRRVAQSLIWTADGRAGGGHAL